VLRISNVSICMILPVLSQELSCICALRISNVFKPGAVMYLCVKGIECVYLYDCTSTKPVVVMYLGAKDIECVYL